ncbi:MAG: fused MFS/spermidine synthase [Thermoleophilia bacterium]|nr:fused MFS/spermidine synthase [Thermoleophilia bacterium]
MLLVFLVGAAALGIEIAVVRLLAPYFGASEVVWANTIGVVLVALSVGYWVGGRVGDSRPRMEDLCAVVMLGAALTALLPFAARPLLEAGIHALDSISAGAFVGSLLATLVLVAIPVLVLGTVAPWALRIGIETIDKRQAGALAGRLYAVSTAGSLVGTLLAALVLVPGVGTRRTFLVFAFALALVALAGMRRRTWFALVPVAVAALFLLPAGSIKASSGDERVLFETETAQQYVRVVERPDRSRLLELNEGQAVHSLYRPGTVLTNNYWDSALVLPLATLGRPPQRIAILGNAAGTMARAYAHFFPATYVDGVDLDPDLTKVGRRYFGLNGRRFTSVAADARPFLRRSNRRYDVIVVDAYRQPYIPFYLTTREFFELASERLTADGSVIVNVGHPIGSDRLEKVLAATIGTAFKHVARDPTEQSNTMLVGSDAPISAARLAGAATRINPQLAALAIREAALRGPAIPGGEVYTDDRAPVEWLVDRSIVSYAAGR